MGEAKRRRIAAAQEFDKLNAELVTFGIDTSEFGFYNQEAFLTHEKKDANFLQKYGQWVISRPVDEKYALHVRTVIPQITDLIVDEFKQYGLEGGCVAASGMLTRILDRLGIWS